MLMIPAIDLLGGQTVRLMQGDYDRQISYAADPVETAQEFADAGADWIHVVDLDGARTGSQANLGVIERIARAVPGKLEVGGGVRSMEAAQRLLDIGVGRVIFGTALVRDPDLASVAFRELGERAVAGIDARDGRVATAGWTEASELLAVDLMQLMVQAGARRFIVTDIAKDGELTGPNLAFMQELAAAVQAAVIASGGVGNLDDLAALAALDPAPEAVIVGRALYEGRFTVAEAMARLAGSLISTAR